MHDPGQMHVVHHCMDAVCSITLLKLCHSHGNGIPYLTPGRACNLLQHLLFSPVSYQCLHMASAIVCCKWVANYFTHCAAQPVQGSLYLNTSVAVLLVYSSSSAVHLYVAVLLYWMLHIGTGMGCFLTGVYFVYCNLLFQFWDRSCSHQADVSSMSCHKTFGGRPSHHVRTPKALLT